MESNLKYILLIRKSAYGGYTLKQSVYVFCNTQNPVTCVDCNYVTHATLDSRARLNWRPTPCLFSKLYYDNYFIFFL